MKDLATALVPGPVPDLDAAFRRLNPPERLAALLGLARDEDLGRRGDVTTASLPDPTRAASAALVARGPGIACGLRTLPALLECYAARFAGTLRLDALRSDGDAVAKGSVLARLAGPLDLLLAVERPLLNLVGRMSGIATTTSRHVAIARGTRACVCETRKTTPGLRGLEKYAVACGGGTLHREGLHDAALYKDNHLAALDPARWVEELGASIRRARAAGPLAFVEVEVDGLAQLDRVLDLGAGLVDVVLLDNFDLEALRAAVARRDRAAPGILLEASGGIDERTLRPVAETGVDRVSIGALTHSVRCLDVGLDAD